MVCLIIHSLNNSCFPQDLTSDIWYRRGKVWYQNFFLYKHIKTFLSVETKNVTVVFLILGKPF